MKIGIVSLYFEISGGANRTTLCLIEALKKTKHFTTLYTIYPPTIKETKNFNIISIPQEKYL